MKKAAEEVREALKKGDIAAIKSSLDNLKKVLQEAGGSIYGKGAGGAGGPGTGGAGPDSGPTGYGPGPQGGSGTGGSENVYDADYKKV